MVVGIPVVQDWGVEPLELLMIMLFITLPMHQSTYAVLERCSCVFVGVCGASLFIVLRCIHAALLYGCSV